jgi:hypothetical protein
MEKRLLKSAIDWGAQKRIPRAGRPQGFLPFEKIGGCWIFGVCCKIGGFSGLTKLFSMEN